MLISTIVIGLATTSPAAPDSAHGPGAQPDGRLQYPLQPNPTGIGISAPAQVGVTAQRVPVVVARHTGYPWDVPVHFEQTADAFMAQIVKVQVVDGQHLRRAGPGRGNRVPAVCGWTLPPSGAIRQRA